MVPPGRSSSSVERKPPQSCEKNDEYFLRSRSAWRSETDAKTTERKSRPERRRIAAQCRSAELAHARREPRRRRHVRFVRIHLRSTSTHPSPSVAEAEKRAIINIIARQTATATTTRLEV